MCSLDLLAVPLSDESWKVRSATVETLKLISARGDQDAILLLAALLLDADGNVRFLAADGLAQIVDACDNDTLRFF